MFRRFAILNLLACWFAFDAHAQDPSFSQSYLNQMYLNPAYTGVNPGLRLGVNYRALWTNIPSRFPTYSIAADVQLPHVASGLGLNAMRDTEGEGYLRTQSFGAFYSYMAELDPKRWYFNAGFQTQLVSKTIDWDKLVFSDQIHPVLGVTGPTGSPRPVAENILYPDFSAGFLLRHVHKNRRRGMTLTYNLGFAMHHLVKPNESILRMTSALPRRYVLHADVLLPFKTDLKSHKRYLINPYAVWEHQEPMRTFAAGCLALFTPIYVGMAYRNQTPLIANLRKADALVVTFGLNDVLPQRDIIYKLGYSYDLTVSNLKSNTHGTHEIALVLENRKFSFVKSAATKKKFICPAF